jgi:L-asparaginase II
VDAISVSVRRGDVVESRHAVHAVAVRDGEVAEAWGAPGLVTYLRSAAKPLQALPLAQLDVGGEELAIACASHEARPEQLAAVRSLLARAGAREDELECGEEHGSKLGHNCSGKHAGMLFVVRRRGWGSAGYRSPEHALQRELHGVVAEATAVPADEIPTATDGCGVVTFAVPLFAMARAFARLVRGELQGAERVAEAMRAHPELIGGPDAVDTLVMRALPGAIAKRGAEGVLCVGLPDGTGVAFKAEDGASRAVYAAAGDVLGVGELAERALVNTRGDEVGKVGPSAFAQRL